MPLSPVLALPQPLLRAARRAGAYGALHGGQPGTPQVGLTVPVPSPAALGQVLEVLAGAGASVTLLVPEQMARQAPDLVRAATQAGQEVSGSGAPAFLTTLEAVAVQPVTTWDADGLGTRDLAHLAAQGVRPLPFPTRTPQHGRTLKVSPAELADTLADLKTNGFTASPVRALPELRGGTGQDLIFHLYTRAVEDRFTEHGGVIDLTARQDGVMRVAPLAHAPAPLPLPRDTPTAELHLYSARLVGLATKQWLGTYRAYQRSLKDVARAMQTRSELQDAQAVFAVTLFHGPLEKVGFELLDLPPLRTRWYNLGFRLLRVAYGTTRTPSVERPRMAWMGREEFLKKFG